MDQMSRRAAGRVDGAQAMPVAVDENGHQPVADDEIEAIGDLGSEFDDPEGWMAERPDYWLDQARGRAMETASRASWLRRRLSETWSALRALGGGPDAKAREDRVPDTVWASLFEAEVGARSQPAGKSSKTAIDAILGGRFALDDKFSERD